MDSILPAELHGVAYISGLRGVGKSFLASQADVPALMCYIDLEEKASAIHSMLKFGKYVSLTSEAARRNGATFKPLHLYDEIKRAFDAIELNTYTTLVIDNISPFEEALKSEVKRDPARYNIDPKKAESGAYGGANPGVHYLVSGYCNLAFSRGIRLVIAVSHVGNTWASGGIVPNKYRPKGVERWQELSVLSLVLIPGAFVPVPAALVQKEQLGSIRFNVETGEHEIQRRLPARLPKATFAEIRRYLREPADLVHPAEGEVPTDAERDPFSEKFSKEQLEYIKLSARIEARQGDDGGIVVQQDPKNLGEFLSRAQMPPDELCKLLNVENVTQIKDFGDSWRKVQLAKGV